MTVHTPDDEHLIWAYRLALTTVTGNVDACEDTIKDVNACGGCWACITREALGVLVEALANWFAAYGEPPRGAAECSARWLEMRLDQKLCNRGR
ncbi:MAG: hypothetical protein ACLP3C_17305 [Mycobacterium sp.]|uniref:hypothetical protein n=1 Tax=Mycobacterium sp. TaxID=1785 RepID=UPI003F9E25E2